MERKQRDSAFKSGDGHEGDAYEKMMDVVQRLGCAPTQLRSVKHIDLASGVLQLVTTYPNSFGRRSRF
jgi:hypothetical protein